MRLVACIERSNTASCVLGIHTFPGFADAVDAEGSEISGVCPGGIRPRSYSLATIYPMCGVCGRRVVVRSHVEGFLLYCRHIALNWVFQAEAEDGRRRAVSLTPKGR